MKIFIEEKEIAVTVGSKISELSASKDTLHLGSLRFGVIKVKDEKIKKKNQSTSNIWLVSCLCTIKCLMESQATFLSLMYFRNLLLLALEHFCFSWST